MTLAKWAVVVVAGLLLCQSGSSIAGPAVGLDGPPVESQLPEHEGIWARQGRSLPQGETRVLLHFISAHHLTLVRSLVATRDRGGRWRVQAIDEERPGLVGSGIRATLLPPWILSVRDSRRLDRLLADCGLYAEPMRQGSRPDQLGVGATFVTVEITTPSAQRTSLLVGRWTGRTGEIARLLSPRD